MCLAVIGLDAHPRFSLVIAANRDEHFARAAAPAQWWPEGWLAGRDLVAGGTWLGIDRAGRWALLTNVREAHRNDPVAPTRGTLVTRTLADARAPQDTLRELAHEAAMYNGFNLIAGAGSRGAWLTNRWRGQEHGPHVQPIGPGTHAISNAALDTPWLKVVNTRMRFDQWCDAGETDAEPLFEALASREQAPDQTLPATGVTLERERLLSAPFVVTADYGTRCSTVVLMARDGIVDFEERTFDRAGHPAGAVRHRFTLE